MVLDLIALKSAATTTRKVVGLTREISGTSGDVICQRADLTAVQSSLDGLSATFRNERNTLDRTTERNLVQMLQPPVDNWEMVGQNFRPAYFWMTHKSEVEDLRRKAEECKVSLLLAVTAAAASIEATHFRTLHSGLCGIYDQLEANHEESIAWLQGLYGSIEGKHSELRNLMRELDKALSRSRAKNHDEALRNHDRAIQATGEVGKNVQEVLVAVVVAWAVTLVAIGALWYFWSGNVGGKHVEAKIGAQDSNRGSIKNHGEVKGWMQDASRSRMQNHHEIMKAIVQVGKKLETLMIGFMMTGVATVVAMAAAGLWLYLRGRKRRREDKRVSVDEQGEVFFDRKCSSSKWSEARDTDTQAKTRAKAQVIL